MQLSLRDEKTKTLFMEVLLELLTKRQDILEEILAKVAFKVTMNAVAFCVKNSILIIYKFLNLLIIILKWLKC